MASLHRFPSGTTGQLGTIARGSLTDFDRPDPVSFVFLRIAVVVSLVPAEVSDRLVKKSSLSGCGAPRMPPLADKLFWTPRQQRPSPMADAASTRFTAPTTLPATRSTSSCHTELGFVPRRSPATKRGNKGILPPAHRR